MENDSPAGPLSATPAGISPFAGLLRRYRRAAGLTQADLAERAGLSPRGIRALEQGERTRPQKDTLRLLAHALDLSPAEQQALLRASRQDKNLTAAPQSRGGKAALPSPLTSFVGRERDVAAIRDLIVGCSVRFLTLTGPGGVGKTRLAQQVATSVQDRFADGVLFVPLASLADPTLVLSAVAQAMGVQEQGEKPLIETLIAALCGRHHLLLLDNFEHLLPASGLIAHLLQAAPSLYVLITSRSPLHLSGEQEYAVPTLSLPDADQQQSLESVSQSEAVRLFVVRARAVKVDFRLTAASAPAVAEICGRLDGLPLAIELAAARSKLFPPAALLARLSPALPLLTGGPRDLPARLQTVRRAIDWSYGLLEPREQQLFARLAVFAGGGTVEAVEAICDLEGDHNFLEQLSSLVDQSLVRRDGEEEPRVVLLETIREYAQERLADQRECEELRERHARWYAAWAEEVGQETTESKQALWPERLDREHSNLRAALQWAQDGDRAEVGLRLAIALSRFWQVRGYLAEGRAWLTTLLAIAGDDIDATLRARVLSQIGELVYAQGRGRDAIELLGQSMALFHQVGDLPRVAEVLGRMANALLDQGDDARAVELLAAHVELGRKHENARLLAMALCLLARYAGWHGNDTQQARVLGEEGLRLYRQMGDDRGILFALRTVATAAYVLGDLRQARAWTDMILAALPHSCLEEDVRVVDGNSPAFAARDRGDYDRAMRLLEVYEARAQELGYIRNAAHARLNLSVLAREQGDYVRARTLAQESLAVFQEAQDLQSAGLAFFAVGHVARDQGDPEGIIGAFEQALRLFQESGNRLYAGVALKGLAQAARYQGDYNRAETLLAESLALCRQRGGKAYVAEVLFTMGLVALEQDQYGKALQAFSESLRTVRTWDWTALEGLASVAAAQGQAERAALLFGAAESFRRAMGTPRWPANEALYQRFVALAREDLADEVFARIWQEGQTLTADQAIAYALDGAAGLTA